MHESLNKKATSLCNFFKKELEHMPWYSGEHVKLMLYSRTIGIPDTSAAHCQQTISEHTRTSVRAYLLPVSSSTTLAAATRHHPSLHSGAGAFSVCRAWIWAGGGAWWQRTIQGHREARAGTRSGGQVLPLRSAPTHLRQDPLSAPRHHPSPPSCLVGVRFRR